MAEYECHAETERGWQLVAESRTLKVAIEKARRVLRANRELGEVFITVPPPVEWSPLPELRERRKVAVVEKKWWGIFIITRSLTHET